MSKQYRVALHAGKPKRNITGRGSLTAIMNHNYRKVGDFAHVDASRSAKNQILIGTEDGIADVQGVISRYKPVRKDSPLYFEVVMTAHQDFFSKKRHELGHNFSKFLNEWAYANIKWAKRQFDLRGKGIVANAVLHLDEQSPHIHMIVVPVVEMGNKGKRICHTHVLGAERGQSIYGNPKMIELQDSYALAMEPFGLVRGERGSHARHQEPASNRKRLAKADKADYEEALEVFGLRAGQLSAFSTDLAAGMRTQGLDLDQIARQGAWWWQGDPTPPALKTRPHIRQTSKNVSASHHRQTFNPASAPASVAFNSSVEMAEPSKTSEGQGMGI